VDEADVEVLVASVVEEDEDVADPLRRRNEGETGASDVEKRELRTTDSEEDDPAGSKEEAIVIEVEELEVREAANKSIVGCGAAEPWLSISSKEGMLNPFFLPPPLSSPPD
jgi:hypothetical protein